MKYKYIIFTSVTLVFAALTYFGFSVLNGGKISSTGTAGSNVTAAISKITSNETKKLTPTDVPHFKPVKLEIPSIGVSADVEETGKDSAGRMGVPVIEENVAWWKYGAKPGETGNSVIAGHYDRKNGGPSVFYRLKDLKLGDTVKVTDEKGNTLNFKVVSKEKFKDQDFPIEKVFGDYKKAGLNLITCDGIWNKADKNYSDRLVVFTELQ